MNFELDFAAELHRFMASTRGSGQQNEVTQAEGLGGSSVAPQTGLPANERGHNRNPKIGYVLSFLFFTWSKYVCLLLISYLVKLKGVLESHSYILELL